MTNSEKAGRREMNAPAPVYDTSKQRVDDTPAFPDEILHLHEINEKIDEAIKQANSSVEHLDGEYTDTN